MWRAWWEAVSRDRILTSTHSPCHLHSNDSGQQVLFHLIFTKLWWGPIILGHGGTLQNLCLCQQYPEDLQKATKQNISEQQQSHEHLRIHPHKSLRYQRSPSAIGTPPVTTFIIIRERSRRWEALCRRSFIKFTPLTSVSSQGGVASSNMMVPSMYVYGKSCCSLE